MEFIIKNIYRLHYSNLTMFIFFIGGLIFFYGVKYNKKLTKILGLND
jgi:hypothetical protein